MAKSDIISTVTARIAAATSATPADELATLKVLGTKLGLNTDNIKSQANTASNTASGKDLYDVTLLNQAIDDYLGINIVNVTLPFAVEQGDVVYANEYGTLFNNSFHDIQANAYQKGIGTSSNSFLGSMYNNVYPLDATNYTYSFSSNTYFTLVADNGDLLNLTVLSDSNYDIEYYTISDNLKRTGITTTVSSGKLVDSSGNTTTAVAISKIYKTATNTWRIYYLVSIGDGYNKICYKQYTYNPSTKTLTGGSTNGVLVAATNLTTRSWTDLSRSTDNLYGCYTYYTGTTNTFFIVDYSTGVATEITNTATTTNSSKTYIVKDTSNNYFLIIANTNDVKIATVPGNVTVTVPATAIPILKYASVNSIGAGEFICANSTGKQVRLLKFAAGLASVTAYTLGTDNTTNGNVIAFITYLKQDNRYYLYSANNNTYSFVWDGTNAPVEKLADGKPLHKYYPDSQGKIDPELKVITGSCDALYSNSTYYTKLYTLTQSVLWSTRCAAMFKVNTAAPANVSTSVRLFENVVSETSKNSYPNALGYTKLDNQFESTKLNLFPAVAAAGSINAAGVQLNTSSNLLTVVLNVGFINKPGRYLLTNTTTFVLHSLHKSMEFLISGTPFTVATIVETNVPFFVQGSVEVNYLGEI